MKNENIIETEAEVKERWKRFKAMTDGEIEAAIASDPDAQVPNDPEFLARGIFVKAGEMVVPITVDMKTINYMAEHHLDYRGFLAGVLRAYVESQQKQNP